MVAILTIALPGGGTKAGVVAEMARGVGVAEGVVENVAVPVELLRVLGVGDDGVGAEKACYMRVIITRAVVVDTQLGVKPLRRVAVIGGYVIVCPALFAPRIIAQPGMDGTIAIAGHVDTA